MEMNTARELLNFLEANAPSTEWTSAVNQFASVELSEGQTIHVFADIDRVVTLLHACVLSSDNSVDARGVALDCLWVTLTYHRKYTAMARWMNFPEFPGTNAQERMSSFINDVLNVALSDSHDKVLLSHVRRLLRGWTFGLAYNDAQRLGMGETLARFFPLMIADENGVTTYDSMDEVCRFMLWTMLAIPAPTHLVLLDYVQNWLLTRATTVPATAEGTRLEDYATLTTIATAVLQVPVAHEPAARHVAVTLTFASLHWQTRADFSQSLVFPLAHFFRGLAFPRPDRDNPVRPFEEQTRLVSVRREENRRLLRATPSAPDALLALLFVRPQPLIQITLRGLFDDAVDVNE